jgi:hypothetical protein
MENFVTRSFDRMMYSKNMARLAVVTAAAVETVVVANYIGDNISLLEVGALNVTNVIPSLTCAFLIRERRHQRAEEITSKEFDTESPATPE